MCYLLIIKILVTLNFREPHLTLQSSYFSPAILKRQYKKPCTGYKALLLNYVSHTIYKIKYAISINMIIPTIIIGNHKNHDGSCNSNSLLMIKNNTCSNSSFIPLSPKCVHKKNTYLSKWYKCYFFAIHVPKSTLV